MASSFSEKMKKKKANELNATTIKEELDNVPDNGILEDIAKPKTYQKPKTDTLSSSIAANKQSVDAETDEQEAVTEESDADVSSAKQNEGNLSYDKAPFPAEIYKPASTGTVPWNCRLSPDVIDKMEYCAYTHGIILRDFMNTILMAEKKFYDEHSEIITIDIVKQNLKKRYTYDNNKIRKGFVLYPECRDILTAYPQKYGMTMTAFMEFLINKYCD